MKDAMETDIGAGDVQDLAAAVDQLTEEVRVLRQSLDELRDDVVWAARNALAGLPPAPPTPVTSMPIDPTARDWAERVNQHSPAELPPESYENVEQLEYCCPQPKLQWYGDPDRPGIACANCGFPVASEGDILCWQNGEAGDEPTSKSGDASSSDPSSTTQQREMF